MTAWYARPVFFVADVDRALDFYVGNLGFAEDWRHVDGARLLAAQAARDGCEVIFSSQWPKKVGSGMLFIALAQAAFDALPGALAAKGVAAKSGHWGYRVLIVDDPDGNQLFFRAPDDLGASS